MSGADLGFADLGYTGSGIVTPRIDSLANDGIILDHYYVMHCCSPTRATLLTGRYPIRYGLQTNVIPANKAYGLNLTETLLPQHLKALGYRTHAIGTCSAPGNKCITNGPTIRVHLKGCF